MERHRLRRRLAGELERGAERFHHAVRLGSGGEVDRHLGEREVPLRRAQLLVRLPRGDGELKRLRIGEPDVLGGHRDRSPEQHQRFLAPLEHPGHPVERAVGIAPPERLVIGRQQVEVLLAGLVVAGHPAGERVRHHLERDQSARAHLLRRGLQRVERPARVAVGLGGEPGDRFVRRAEVETAQPALPVRERRPHHLLDRGLRERLEHEHLAAGEQRGVQAEARVLGGGPDQRDGPPLHVGEKGILLGAVEAVDLVAEEDGAPAGAAALLGLMDDLPHPLHALGHGAEADEGAAGVLRDEIGERGLPAARRAPQDGAAEVAAAERVPQRVARREQLLLPGEFLQRPGPHPGGERRRGREELRGVVPCPAHAPAPPSDRSRRSAAAPPRNAAVMRTLRVAWKAGTRSDAAT